MSLNCAYASGRFFFFQAEDGIRDLVRSRGLGDVYKRQVQSNVDYLCDYLSRTAGSEAADAAVEELCRLLNLSLIHI